MFQEDIKDDDRSSNVTPILLIAAICLTIAATAVYVMHEARKGMSQAEAKRAVTAMLEQRPPAMLHFRVGLVTPSATVKPSDPHYQLLERAQIVTLEKRDNKVQVSLTEDGAKLLNSIAGTTHTRTSDGTKEYSVPLGTREVVAVTSVNVNSPSSATIHYTWKWQPTAMGDVFDLAGNYASGLDVWNRAALAKQGADLYHEPAIEDEYNATSGWQLARN
jgi:hypothetical protein